MRLQKSLPLLSWREAGTQFVRNGAAATRYMIPNMLDNSNVLRNNAFIVGSLVLVCSRIVVANLTALKSKGTPDGPYRYQEAMRTTLRESGGWILSYAVLRQIQNLMSTVMRRAYGIKTTDPSVPPAFFSQISKNAKAFMKRQPLDQPIRWVESAEAGTFTCENTRATRATVNLLRKIPGLAQKDASSLIRHTFNWVPLGVGSLFSIIASGFVLEAITRDKSDEVIQSVSRMFHPKTSKPSSASAQNALSVSQPAVNMAFKGGFSNNKPFTPLQPQAASQFTL